MVKVKCGYPWDFEYDGGYMKKPGESEEEAKARLAEEMKDRAIRPCGLHHGWVYKDKACKRCKHCIEFVEE